MTRLLAIATNLFPVWRLRPIAKAEKLKVAWHDFETSRAGRPALRLGRGLESSRGGARRSDASRITYHERAICFRTEPSAERISTTSGIWPTAWVEQLKQGS